MPPDSDWNASVFSVKCSAPACPAPYNSPLEIFRIATPTMDTLHQELKLFIIETMNLEDITPDEIDSDAPLFSDEGLGLDSIDALELVLGLKKKYGIVLEAGDEASRQHLRSVSSLASLVAAHR